MIDDGDCESGGRNATATAAGKFLLLWQYPTSTGFNTSMPASGSEGTSIAYGDVSDVLVYAATYVGANNTLRVSSWADRDTAVRVRNAFPRVDGDDVRLVQANDIMASSRGRKRLPMRISVRTRRWLMIPRSWRIVELCVVCSRSR